MPDGEFRPAQLVQRQAQVVVGARVTRLELEEPTVVFDRGVEVALLVGDHPQHQDGLGVLLLGEDAAACVLGLLQAPAAEMVPGEVAKRRDFRVGCGVAVVR